MRCHRARTLYDEYSSATLPLATVARVEEHLAGCPPCREFFEQHDQIARALRRAAAESQPHGDYFKDLNRRVLAQLEQPVEPAQQALERAAFATPSQARQPLWWGAALAAACLVGIAVIPLVAQDQNLADLSTVAAVATPPSRAGGAMPAEVAAIHNPPTPANQSGGSGEGGDRVAVANASNAINNFASAPARGVNGAEVAATDLFGNRSTSIVSNSIQPLVLPGAAHIDGKDIQIAAAVPDLVLWPSTAAYVPPNAPEGRRHISPAVEAAIAQEAIISNSGSIVSNASRNYRSSAPQSNSIRTVSFGSGSLRSRSRMPAEVSLRLQQINGALPANGELALVPQLRELDAALDRRGEDEGELRASASVRAPLLYLQAADLRQAGKPLEACTALKGIILIDPTGPFAVRAHLQLADLSFSEFADFREADANYRACLGKPGAAALSSAERERVRRQLERLEQFRVGDYEPLHLVQLIRTGGWAQSAAALQRMTEIAPARPLLPEAAQTIAGRINNGDKPDNPTALRVYNLLEKQASLAQNGAQRAWFCLSLGQMAEGQYGDVRRAGELYRQAATADAESPASKAARVKLADLSSRLLLEPAR